MGVIDWHLAADEILMRRYRPRADRAMGDIRNRFWFLRIRLIARTNRIQSRVLGIDRHVWMLYKNGDASIYGDAWAYGEEIVKRATEFGLSSHVESLDDVGCIVVRDSQRPRVPFLLRRLWAR